MKLRYISHLLCLITLLALTSCARYHAQPLQPLLSATPVKKTPHIAMNYKVFDMHDCKAFLGRNVVERGYQPIQIALYNHSHNILYLSPENISLPTVSASIMAQIMRYSPWERWPAGVASFLAIYPGIPIIVELGSIIATRKAGMAASLAFAMLLSSVVIIGLTAAIVGNIESSSTRSTNQKLTRDYADKELRTQLIDPSQTINGIIFVPIERFRSEFSLVVIDQTTNKSYTLTPENPVADI